MVSLTWYHGLSTTILGIAHWQYLNWKLILRWERKTLIYKWLKLEGWNCVFHSPFLNLKLLFAFRAYSLYVNASCLNLCWLLHMFMYLIYSMISFYKMIGFAQWTTTLLPDLRKFHTLTVTTVITVLLGYRDYTEIKSVWAIWNLKCRCKTGKGSRHCSCMYAWLCVAKYGHQILDKYNM